jgi:hypothetical protein
MDAGDADPPTSNMIGAATADTETDRPSVIAAAKLISRVWDIA